MSKKYFVVGDVHGFYDELKKALDRKGFDIDNPDHIFVSCGDLLDRGRQPKECLEFVMSIPDDRRILIQGNHEDLLMDCLYSMKITKTDEDNGTANTIKDLADPSLTTDIDRIINVKNNKLLKSYFYSLYDYAETSKYIIVHGWIPCIESPHKVYIKYKDHMTKWHKAYVSLPDWHYATPEQWSKSRWINGMCAWAQGVKTDKTIICGHWHTSWARAHLEHSGNEFPNYRSTNPDHYQVDLTPWYEEGIIAIDGCVALTHTVNCITFEE